MFRVRNEEARVIKVSLFFRILQTGNILKEIHCINRIIKKTKITSENLAIDEITVREFSYWL